MRVMRIPVAVSRHEPEKTEPEVTALYVASRIAGFSLLFGGSALIVGCVFAAPFVGVSAAFEGWAIGLGMMVVGGMILDDPFSDS